MGNHRFKLSNMMPNAWFYKLRDMSKVRSHNPSHSVKKNSQSSSRKSFYYSTESVRMDNKLCVSPQNPKFYDATFPHDPPRKPSRKIAPSESDIPVWLRLGNIHDYRSSHVDDPISPDRADLALSGFDCDDSLDQSCLSPCSCKLSSSATDIVIDGINIDFDMISEPDLPPIQTKPGRQESPIKYMMEKQERNRRSSSSPGGRKSFSGGVKIRKGGSKKAGGRRRKSVKEERKKGLFYSESFAIVKASLDPEKDFRESMMEMIEENKIRESKDLEDLLACYLSLNPNQYHYLIIKAFEQIWFNMHQLHL